MFFLYLMSRCQALVEAGIYYLWLKETAHIIHKTYSVTFVQDANPLDVHKLLGTFIITSILIAVSFFLLSLEYFYNKHEINKTRATKLACQEDRRKSFYRKNLSLNLSSKHRFFDSHNYYFYYHQ